MAGRPDGTSLIATAATTKTPGMYVGGGIGYQKVAMGRDVDVGGNSRRHVQEVRHVRIDLCLCRLPDQSTDVLVTLTAPISSGSGGLAELGSATTAPSFNPIFHRVITTLKVRDWGLFG
jgi:hypothetical protein